VLQWRAEAAGGGRTRDGARRLRAEKLLELAVGIALGGNVGPAEVYFGTCGSGNFRLRRN
jgi:hypothetical protein